MCYYFLCFCGVAGLSGQALLLCSYSQMVSGLQSFEGLAGLHHQGATSTWLAVDARSHLGLSLEHQWVPSPHCLGLSQYVGWVAGVSIPRVKVLRESLRQKLQDFFQPMLRILKHHFCHFLLNRKSLRPVQGLAVGYSLHLPMG